MATILFLLVLGLAIVFHELGHFIFARIFGVRVYRFSLFFSPGFSIADYDNASGTLRLINRTSVEEIVVDGNIRHIRRVKPMLTLRLGRPHPECSENSWRRTIFSLGWLPCGGFCSIADQQTEPGIAPRPWTLAAKSPAKRIAVHIAGVLFNFITAILALTVVYFFFPTQNLPPESFPKGFAYGRNAHEAGFRDGDVITEIEGHRFDFASNGGALIYYASQESCPVKLLRDGKQIKINMPSDPAKRTAVANELMNMTPIGMDLRVGDGDTPDGLNPGDRIIAFNGTAVNNAAQLQKLLSSSTEPVLTAVDSTGAQFDVAIAPGATIPFAAPVYPQAQTHLHEGSYALTTGVGRGLDIMYTVIRHPQLLFANDPASVLIYNAAETPLQQAILSFAIISLFMVLFNILPIPGLDGSKIWLPLYEFVTHRKAPEKIRMAIDAAGRYVLLALFCWFIISIFI